MNDPTREDHFEVYPYAEPEQSPGLPPVAEDPGTALAQPSVTPPRDTFGEPSIERRGLLFGVLGIGVAGLVGVSVVNSENQEPDAGPRSTDEGVPVDEVPAGDTVWILLQTPEGDLGLDVPSPWEVLREGDLVHLRTEDGCELVARVPEPPARATEAQLRLEAEYTRARFEAEFVPDGEMEASQTNDPPFEVFTLRTTGTADGVAAEEHVTYIIDTDRERALVVAARVGDEAEPDIADEAQRMADQLVEEFRSL